MFLSVMHKEISEDFGFVLLMANCLLFKFLSWLSQNLKAFQREKSKMLLLNGITQFTQFISVLSKSFLLHEVNKLSTLFSKFEIYLRNCVALQAIWYSWVLWKLHFGICEKNSLHHMVMSKGPTFPSWLHIKRSETFLFNYN